MLKLARLAILALIVSGFNIQSASACLWWNWNSCYGYGCGYNNCYNSCWNPLMLPMQLLNPCHNPCYTPCYSPCYSPCYTPCQPMCDPCGYSGAGTIYPAQSGYRVNGPAWSNNMTVPQNGMTTMTTPGVTIQGSTVPMTPQSMSPYQGTLPQTWYATPQTPGTTIPETKSESTLPPKAEALESTRSDWNTIGPQSQQNGFQNVTLQKRIPSRRRSVRAPSAAAVWQHMNSAR